MLAFLPKVRAIHGARDRVIGHEAVSSRLARAALTCGLLLFGSARSGAEPVVQQVLVLQSFARGNLTLDHFTGDFRVDLDQIAGRPVNVVQVVVGPTGFIGAPEQAVVEYIRSTFVGRSTPDLIVTIGGPAAVFGRKYRQQLFPETPILFASVDERYLRTAPLGENETAVAVINDFPGLVDDILRVLPETRHVFMVLGSGSLGKFWRRELEHDFQRFRGRLEFIWSDELSLAEIVRRCATLPAHSAIFYLSFNSDAQGGAYADERVMAELRATANAPLFTGINVFLGTGVVGGTMMSIDALSRSTAEVAVRLLNGALPSRIRVPPQPTGPPMFDWRELQRWGIGESRLPPGSVVRYRAPSPWQQYRFTVLGVLGALVVQSLLIGGLLFERRARRRAEVDSRRNLALAADASRRATMSALTSSIGHELGQPLTALLHNAEALQIMVATNRATADAVGEIVTDIYAEIVQATQIIDRHRSMLRSRQLEKNPIDLHAVIKASIALLAHDMRARHVEATVHVSPVPCVVIGDPVLLQQVFVNLVVNAFDAMAERPPAGRHLTIRSDVRASDVEVSVRDTGPGLPAHINGKLFAPFVTTKTHGLGIGLTIARTIVDAHGGTIEARDNPGGGATFAVTLRRSAAPEGLAHT